MYVVVVVVVKIVITLMVIIVCKPIFHLSMQTENKLRRSIQNDMLWNYMLRHSLVLQSIVSEIRSAYGIPVHCMKHPL